MHVDLAWQLSPGLGVALLHGAPCSRSHAWMMSCCRLMPGSLSHPSGVGCCCAAAAAAVPPSLYTAPATGLCTHSMQLVIRAWCRFSFTGFNAWLAWRSAYFTRLASMRNRVYLLTNWTTTLIFGRDMSRF